MDQAWGTFVLRHNVKLAKADEVRLRELEAIGVNDVDSLMRAVSEGKEFRMDDFYLMERWQNLEQPADLAQMDVTIKEWQDVKDLYQAGRLGFTFAKNPERMTTYLNALQDPEFDMEAFVGEYQDQGAELLGALINPVNFALPAAVDKVLFPLGPLVVTPALKGVTKGAGALLKRIPVMKYLTAISKQSKLVSRTDEMYDVAACLVLRTEREGVSQADTIGRMMLGDEDILRHLPESMRETALELGTRLHEELGKRKKSATYEDLWEWVYAGAIKGIDEPAAIEEMRKASEPAKVVAVAFKRVFADELGIKPPWKICKAEKTWRHTGAVLKDNWLSFLAAFHSVNELGDRTRQALRGLDPLRYPSQSSAERVFSDYGVALANVEHTYMDDIIERYAGEAGPTARLPIPGIGKPRYAIEALKDWLGFEVSGKGPLAWAARVTTGAAPPFKGTLGETVGKGWVWLADHANLGSLNDVASGYGSAAEAVRRRSAAMQLFLREVATERKAWQPRALERLSTLDIPQPLREGLERDLRGVKNPSDIRLLADTYLTPPKRPIVFQHVPETGPVPIDADAADFIMDKLGGKGRGLVEDFNPVFDDAVQFYRDEYKFLLVEGVDEATAMHKFFEEYWSGLGDNMRPKDLDAMQRIRAAVVEDKLQRVTMYDVPDTYMMARIGDVAQYGETTGIFDTYFRDTFPTEATRKAEAERIIRAFNSGETTASDVMEAITESYNTMLRDMGIPRQYEYGRIVPLTGKPPTRVKNFGPLEVGPRPWTDVDSAARWLEKDSPELARIRPMSERTPEEIESLAEHVYRENWTMGVWNPEHGWGLAKGRHAWEPTEALYKKAGGRVEIPVLLTTTPEGVYFQQATYEAGEEVLAENVRKAAQDLLDEGVPPNTPAAIQAGDLEVVPALDSTVGELAKEPVTQRFARRTADPLAAANDAIKRAEVEQFAKQTGTKIEVPPMEAMAAETQSYIPETTGPFGLAPSEEELARRTREALEVGQEVLTPRGVGTIQKVLGEEAWSPLIVVELKDGTTESFSREFVSRGEPTLATSEEATFQAWNNANLALRDEWRLDIERRIEDATNYLEDWRDQLVAHAQRYNVNEWMIGKEREKLVPILEDLADQWSESVEKARLRSIVGMNEIMFDYSRKSNFERHTEFLAPFTTYQYRSIPFFAMEAATNWKIPRFFDLYDRYSEMERERRGLSERFKGTVPVPFQEQLQERGILPEGYFAMDPKQLMLWQGTVGAPFESPGEQQMEGPLRTARQVATAPEQVGVRYWPWIQAPLEMAGVYGPRETGRMPWQIGGMPSRVFPQLEEPLTRLRGARPVQAYQRGGMPEVWQDLAKTMSTPSRENWVRSYYISTELAGMAQRGEITVEEAREAQYNPTSPVYQQAAQQYDKTQRGISLARTVTPFGIKYAGPGELALRGAREEGAALRPGVSELWWRARQAAEPEEKRKAEFEQADMRREYLSELRKIQARRDQELANLSVESRRYEITRKRHKSYEDALREKYEGRIDWGPAQNKLDAIHQQLLPEKFKDRLGEIDWDRYNAARERMYEELGPEWEQALEERRTRGWGMQRLAGEPHEAWLREGQERFFAPALVDEIERLEAEIATVQRDRTLSKEEQRRQEQLLYDQLEPLRASRDEVVKQYGRRPLEAYREEVGGLAPDTSVHEASRLLQQYPEGAGLQDYWLRGKEEPEALERVVKNAFYGQPDAAQFQHRQELGPDFAAWLRGEMTPERQQLEEWVARIPGGRQAAKEAGVTLRRYETPSDAWLRERFGPTGPIGPEMAPPTPESTELFGTATRHMREWRLGERQDWSGEMTQVFGSQDSGRSKWWEEVGRVSPYLDWEKLNQDRDASALFSGNMDDETYEREAAQGFPTLMQYVDQTALSAEVPEIRQAADKVQAEWPKVPEELAGVQTDYFGMRTGYDKNKWKEAHPTEYAQLQGHWNEQMVFQWENPEYTFIHRPENFRRWWGDMSPEQVRANLDKNVTLVKQALADMSTYTAARSAGEYGEWTDAMSEVFEDPEKESVKFWDLYYHIPPSSFGQPMKEIEHIALLRSPVIKKFFPTADIPDDFYKEAMQLLQEQLDTYSADPNVPHYESEEEIDQLNNARAQYFRIRDWEEEYPQAGVYDPDQFLRDNPILAKWYPYFTEGWWTQRRPMNPYAAYGAGDGGGGGDGGNGEGGVGPPPSW
jgi:hypothetical protein